MNEIREKIKKLYKVNDMAELKTICNGLSFDKCEEWQFAIQEELKECSSEEHHFDYAVSLISLVSEINHEIYRGYEKNYINGSSNFNEWVLALIVMYLPQYNNKLRVSNFTDRVLEHCLLTNNSTMFMNIAHDFVGALEHMCLTDNVYKVSVTIKKIYKYTTTNIESEINEKLNKNNTKYKDRTLSEYYVLHTELARKVDHSLTIEENAFSKINNLIIAYHLELKIKGFTFQYDVVNIDKFNLCITNNIMNLRKETNIDIEELVNVVFRIYKVKIQSSIIDNEENHHLKQLFLN